MANRTPPKFRAPGVDIANNHRIVRQRSKETWQAARINRRSVRVHGHQAEASAVSEAHINS
jgi:hypothetical protein